MHYNFVAAVWYTFQGSYQCRCQDGFTGNGISCRDINECLTNNGGCDQNAQCINTEGSFKCVCDAGFRGDGYSCTDIDECTNDPTLCENGQCLNYPGSFRCECEMGFMHPDEGNDQTCVGKLSKTQWVEAHSFLILALFLYL